MKKFILVFWFLPTLLFAQNSIVWDFNENNDGWQVSSAECELIWQPEGAVKLVYQDGSGDGAIHAQIKVNQTFDAALYPYIEIFYKTDNWPATASTSFMAGFRRTAEGNNSYIFTTLNPQNNYVCVKIADSYINWGPSPNSYSGEMNAVILEIPHNSVSSNASAWTGGSVTITKIILTDTPSSSEPKWTFDSGLEGWSTLADNVDISLSQQDGKMHVTYVDGTGGAGYAPLNTPRIALSGLSIDASSIDTFKMTFNASWPVPSGTAMPVLVSFTVDAGLSYCFFNINPESGSVAVNIRDNDPTWGVPLAGIISKIDIELPHNSAQNANNGDLWFSGSYIDIDNIALVPEIITIPKVSEWSFDTGLEGWDEFKDGNARDVNISWQDGAMIMTYADNATSSGPQLWFPQVRTSTSFDAASYPYVDIHYETVDWPTTSTVSALIGFTKSDGSLSYSFFQLNPADTFLCVDIAKFDPGWATPYSGEIASLYLEIPHNSSGNPASAWFGASTRVKKIRFTDTFTTVVPEPNPKYRTAHWTFDADFTDSVSNISGIPSGNPSIKGSVARTGPGALVLDGNDFLSIPADEVFTSEDITFAFWIKTPAGGQVNSGITRIISFGSLRFELAFNQGNLSFSYDGRLWNTIVKPWQDNLWQHLAITADGNNLSFYLNGSKAGQLLNAVGQDRTGIFKLGNDALSAFIDEFSVYNYALSEAEIAKEGMIPPRLAAPWTFDNDLEGWHEIADGNDRDVNLSWNEGAMVMTYADNAGNNGPQLWFPQAEVFTSFDAALFSYCDIYYETSGWPASSTVKALLEFTKVDGTVAYSYFDFDPSATYARVDIVNTDPGWGVKYSGRMISVRLEIPHNGSANVAEDWFGASVKITKIELNDTQPPVSEAWQETLNSSAFIKSGLERLNYPYYQYQPVGLGGTAMRVDPWGFGYHVAPGVASQAEAWHPHEPYYGYEYWWDREGHRFNPYRLKAGYGASFNPGTIKSFDQKLDISTGVLDIDLALEVEGTSFTTHRNVFVTPGGILVIRVKDTGAPSPLQLNVMVETDVRIYNNSGIYAVPHDPFTGSAAARETGGIIQGSVITATRPGTSTAALAVAVESQSSLILSGDNTILSTTDADGTLTFYIAPASSFNPETPDVPWDHAWNAAYAAKLKGYETLRQETADWWADYMNLSKISIPDEKVAKLYAQSLFFHGVYFGESSIPPGCNSTDIESFAGAVCPEYDLTFSQLALLYTGHLSEAKNIADWTYSVLPKAKEYATGGITHHNVSKIYSGGAKYTTLMGFDGALTVQPVDFEGGNLNSNYPGANSALMAISYLDYSNDESFREAALDILKSTTWVTLEDLIYDSRFDAYRCKYAPSTVQQASALMGYEECVKRGIAEPEWEKYEGRIIIPKSTLNGDTLIAGGVGAVSSEAVGDATWLQHIWWDGGVSKHDPVALPSYKNSAKTSTGDYVFNSGWMGVIASKLYLGGDALTWLQRFQKTDILYDETCFTEARGNFMYTPEIGAHGAYICNLSQMLVDPDNDQVIDIFPAIPDAWEYKRIEFSDLLTKGGVSVSAGRDLYGVKVDVTNTSGSEKIREIRIKIPRLLLVDGMDLSEIPDGFIINNLSLLPGETKSLEYSFSSFGIPSSVSNEEAMFDAGRYTIYPNPNSTGILNVSDSENIEEILVYSLTGNMVRKFQNQGQSYNLKGLESGIYIIQIKADKKYFAKRLYIIK